MERIIIANSAQATEQAGWQLAQICPVPGLVYLHGDLGSGKTTFTRGFLRAVGHRGTVKSPTFTLVEEYALPLNAPSQFAGGKVYHLDLYRLADAQELEYIGIREYLADRAVMLVEWPELGAGVLPVPDVVVHLQYIAQGRRIAILTQG